MEHQAAEAADYAAQAAAAESDEAALTVSAPITSYEYRGRDRSRSFRSIPGSQAGVATSRLCGPRTRWSAQGGVCVRSTEQDVVRL